MLPTQFSLASFLLLSWLMSQYRLIITWSLNPFPLFCFAFLSNVTFLFLDSFQDTQVHDHDISLSSSWQWFPWLDWGHGFNVGKHVGAILLPSHHVQRSAPPWRHRHCVISTSRVQTSSYVHQYTGDGEVMQVSSSQMPLSSFRKAGTWLEISPSILPSAMWEDSSKVPSWKQNNSLQASSHVGMQSWTSQLPELQGTYFYYLWIIHIESSF